MKLFKFFIYINILIFSFFDCHCRENNIYIYAESFGDLFPIKDHDERNLPFIELKKTLNKLGINLIQTKDLKNLNNVKLIVFFNIPIKKIEILNQINKSKAAIFLWEPPTTKPYNYERKYHATDKIFTWNDNLIDNKKYFKFYYPALRAMIEPVMNFEDKKLCTLIAGNKNSFYSNELYSKRLEIINFFENFESDFDFYGTDWPVKKYKNYKGKISEKVDILKKYKFCIAYENINQEKGYITEKIFDCFWAGCIPIYWGAPNVQDYIPKDCFIDRRHFKSDLELYKFLKSMNKEMYESYIENIKNFLKSEKARLYSIDNFISIFLKLIR